GRECLCTFPNLYPETSSRNEAFGSTIVYTDEDFLWVCPVGKSTGIHYEIDLKWHVGLIFIERHLKFRWILGSKNFGYFGGQVEYRPIIRLNLTDNIITDGTSHFR